LGVTSYESGKFLEKLKKGIPINYCGRARPGGQSPLVTVSGLYDRVEAF